jgi:hypothetical protein
MALRELPLEMLTHVCQHLGLADLVRVAATCKGFRHGGLETVELPTGSPVVMVLRTLAFTHPELVPSTRPIGSESWVSYLARCARQRRCRESPPLAAAEWHSLFRDATGRLLACGRGGVREGHGNGLADYIFPTLVAAMPGIRVRTMVAAHCHSLALGWDGRVYSWGENRHGELGHGDKLTRASPALVEGLVGVRGIAAFQDLNLAVTQSGAVYQWGKLFCRDSEDTLRPTIVAGFGGVRVSRVFAGRCAAFAIGEDGELFSWGEDRSGRLGHGDRHDQPAPSASRRSGTFV